MKNLRKLLPAFAMLLLSAVLMSTASYAWFSMNKTVSATGMKVTAKSDSLSLVIKAGKDQTISADDVQDSAGASLDVQLLPVTPAISLTSANIETNSSWQYGYSDSEDSANVNTSGYTAVPEGATLLGTGNYVVKQTFTIGLQNSTNGATSASNLKLTGATITADKGVTVVVVCGNKITAEHAATFTGGTEVLAETVTKGSPVNVDVYIFIDGDNANVKTDNIDTLNGTVELTFAVD